MKKKKNLNLKNSLSFNILCLGCAQNEYDAQKIKGILEQKGWRLATDDRADLIIVLSCSVRQSAIDRVWGKLNRWKRKKNIFVIGCVLPQDKKKLRQKYPQLVIEDTETFLKKIPGILNLKAAPSAQLENGRQAFVPIQFGCDNFCAYCAVPFTRGREKSRPVKDIIAEIKELIRQKKTVITLLGQNVNSYGQSRRQKAANIRALRQMTGDKLLLENERQRLISSPTGSFSRLLEQIEKIPGLERLDFLSPNPQDMTDDVIEWMARSKKFTQRLNLPLQSGSDKILQKMNRRYNAAQYLRLVQKIKKAVASIQLTTDVIVGFPGETKKDFAKTYDLCRRIGFKQIYIGKYSPRPGTVAERFFKDDVSWEEKKSRWRKLNRLIQF